MRVSKSIGLAGILLGVSTVVGAAQAQSPGAIVTPMTVPMTGQMQSDIIKQQTDEAAKKALDAESGKAGKAGTADTNTSKAPADSVK